VKIRPENKKKTAFSIDKGLWFTVMSYFFVLFLPHSSDWWRCYISC